MEVGLVLGAGSVVTLEDLPSRVTVEPPLTVSENLSYRDGVNAARKELVVRALRRTDGNRSAAAKLLGLEAKYFLKLMKSLRID